MLIDNDEAAAVWAGGKSGEAWARGHTAPDPGCNAVCAVRDVLVAAEYDRLGDDGIVADRAYNRFVRGAVCVGDRRGRKSAGRRCRRVQWRARHNVGASGRSSAGGRQEKIAVVGIEDEDTSEGRPPDDEEGSDVGV
jgi:hypothetical protein